MSASYTASFSHSALSVLIGKSHFALIWVGADLCVKCATDNLPDLVGIPSPVEGLVITELFDELAEMDEIVKEVVCKERESFSVELIEKETAEGFSNYISMLLYPMEMPDGEDGLLLVCENIRVGSVIQGLTQRYSELRLSQSRLMRIAMTDPVTGLGNRYAYEHDVSERALTVIQNPVDLVVAVIGLDGLRAVNAAQGHAQGDVLLRTYAATLQSILRDGDIVYRVGGDEFIALLETSAYAGFERLYQKFEDVVEQVRKAGFPDTQVSVGIAALSETGYNMSEAISLADRRMYAYKKKLYGKDI